MTRELLFLFIGYAVVWLVLFGYLVYVTGRIIGLREDIRELREHLEEETTETSHTMA